MAALCLHAGEGATVYGVVLDRSNGQPLVAVNVLFKNTAIGTMTNEEGCYFIQNIPPGNYELITSMMGYEHAVQNLRLLPGDRIKVDFRMKQTILDYGKNVLVTASRTQKLIEEIPASVDLIDEETLSMIDPQDVGEALKNIKGLMIKSYGGLGSTQTISLRGSSSEQVLILVDGQRINNVQNGQVDLSNLPSHDIEKIEVVKGASSALYGSDAVGGVINIITRSPGEEDRFSISAKGILGSFHSRSFVSSLNYAVKGLAVNASYKYLYSLGDFDYTDNYGTESTRLNADIASHSFNGGLGYKFTRSPMDPEIRLKYDHYSSERGAPGTIEPYYYEARMWDRSDNVSMNFNSKIFNPFNDIRFTTSYRTTWNRYLNNEMLVPTDNSFGTRALNSELQGHSVLNPYLVLTYGIGGQSDAMENEQLDTTYRRLTFYAFVMNESIIKFDRPFLRSLILTPSLRFDSHSDFNDVLSPKIGLVLNFGETWKTGIKSNFGLSYRAPTFNDLYWPEDAYTVGNPELEAESGRDWDLGFRLQFPVLDGMYLESAFFHNRMTNLIIWESNAGMWMPDNVDEALIKGLENGLKLNILEGYLSADINYTYLRAINLSGSASEYGKQLVYRPKHTFNFSLLGVYRMLSVQYGLNITGKRYTDRTNSEVNALPAYAVSDLMFLLKPHIRDLDMNVNFQISNLFNAHYTVMKNLPMPGREYRISFEVKFNQKTNKRRVS